MDKLLQRIKLQASGEAEAPPITLPDWLDEDDLDGDDEEDSVEASAAGVTGFSHNPRLAGFWLALDRVTS